MIDMTKEHIKKANKPMPAVIMDGPYGYRKLLDNKDIDAVVISTPWLRSAGAVALTIAMVSALNWFMMHPFDERLERCTYVPSLNM